MKTEVALVRWFDSSITIGETIHEDDIPGILENLSAGLVIAEDQESITLALDRCPATKGLRCVICIPKVNIRSIERRNL